MSHCMFEVNIYIVGSLETQREEKGKFVVCVFYVVSLFLLDLVFSNCEMKKEHDRIMVESEGYREIVCFLFIYFILSDVFA